MAMTFKLISLILVIICGLFILISYFYNQSKSLKIIANTNDQNIVLVIAILTLLSSFSFYGLRLFIRLLFHQMSTWADAADRVIACRTYIENQNNLSVDNKKILFQRIFKEDLIYSLEKVEPKPGDLLKIS